MVNKRALVQKGLTAQKKGAIITRNDFEDTLQCSLESEGAHNCSGPQLLPYEVSS